VPVSLRRCVQKTPGQILGADCHSLRSRDFFTEFGNAQAAFGSSLAAFFFYDLGIDQDELGLGSSLNVTSTTATRFRNPDLRGS